MKIFKLSDQKIKQIAAGEVIAHPFNAIKETIENSIDAGAKNITIHIEKNGLEKITIIDDGCGMDLEDLKICTQMHTTSKTAENEHFFGTRSLGFRGEALSSIDAISDLHIETNGQKWHKNTLSPSSIKIGTKIEIKNMFANLPARLKFLKSSTVEWANIRQILQKYMVNFEKINWTIFNNGKRAWQVYESDRTNRIQDIFKSDFVREKIQNFSQNSQENTVQNTPTKLEIEIFLLKNHNNFSAIFVNNRPIKDKALNAYIRSIFREFFMKQENPSYLLFIEIDPIFVDCNVHPTKEEVKFLNYSQIFSLLSQLFSPNFFRTFYQTEHLNFEKSDFFSGENCEKIPEKDNKIEENLNLEQKIFENFAKKDEKNYVSHVSQMRPNKPIFQDNFSINKNKNSNFPLEFQQNILNETDEKTTQTPLEWPKNPHPHIKILGQILNSFIIFETIDGIGIFDQHAAHERHLYEQMKRQLSAEFSQKLLVTQTLNLDEKSMEFLEKNRVKFAKKGLEIIGAEIVAVPSLLIGENLSKFLENALNQELDYEITLERLLADIACKKALKANSALSFEQMSELLKTSLENVPICNHGRPVFKYFSASEIANWFKR